jgi:ATP-dependent Clp protease ATP-binding subunit ClpC
MFERYTENARRALFFARYEASQLGDLEIKAEHLLLGLARNTKGVVARILAERGISGDDIRREIENRSVFREKVSTSVEIPFNNETKQILQGAAEEADALGHQHIGTEHLLLAILRREQSDTARILFDRGVRYDDTREAVLKLVAEGASPHLAESTEPFVLLKGLNSLLDRLAKIAPDTPEVRSLIEDIRERVRTLERQLGDRSE